MDLLRDQIIGIANEIREGQTVTLRQLYYALTVRRVLNKTETDYKRLAQITSIMRREKVMPYHWIEDGTRITYVPPTYDNARAALEDLAGRYLESPWTDAEVAPEIWIEKDALAGIVYDVTFDYCVPLRVQRGYASLSALYRAAQDIQTRGSRGITTQVYYLRDLDPSGADAARAAEETVLDMLGRRASGRVGDGFWLPPFEIIGVTPEQVSKWNLPTRPNKNTDTRTANFRHATSVELDAIPPQRLRGLVVAAIEQHLPEAAKRAHEAQVNSTRVYLRSIAEAAA